MVFCQPVESACSKLIAMEYIRKMYKSDPDLESLSLMTGQTSSKDSNRLDGSDDKVVDKPKNLSNLALEDPSTTRTMDKGVQTDPAESFLPQYLLGISSCVVSVVLSFVSMGTILSIIVSCGNEVNLTVRNGMLELFFVVVVSSYFLLVDIYQSSIGRFNPLITFLYWMARIVSNVTAIVVAHLVRIQEMFDFPQTIWSIAWIVLLTDCIFSAAELCRVNIKSENWWATTLALTFAYSAATVELYCFTFLIGDIIVHDRGTRKHAPILVLLSISMLAIVLWLLGARRRHLKPEAVAGVVTVAAAEVMLAGDVCMNAAVAVGGVEAVKAVEAV